MANTNAPNGFTLAYTIDGRTQNAAQAARLIDPTYATPIYIGDPVTSDTSGFIIRAAAGTTQIAGIFNGCSFFNPSTGTVQRGYWPGVSIGASGTVNALICNDPSSVFEVQAGGTNVGFAHIDANIQFNLGTGNALTQLSGAYVETPSDTNTLPFRIVALKAAPPGANGTDIAGTYNRLYVTFNNQDFKSLTGIN